MLVRILSERYAHTKCKSIYNRRNRPLRLCRKWCTLELLKNISICTRNCVLWICEKWRNILTRTGTPWKFISNGQRISQIAIKTIWIAPRTDLSLSIRNWNRLSQSTEPCTAFWKRHWIAFNSKYTSPTSISYSTDYWWVFISWTSY